MRKLLCFIDIKKLTGTVQLTLWHKRQGGTSVGLVQTDSEGYIRLDKEGKQHETKESLHYSTLLFDVVEVEPSVENSRQ